MYTFQDLYEQFTKITSDTSSNNIDFGKALVNQTHELICDSYNWTFLYKNKVFTTTVGQSQVILPNDTRIVQGVSVTSGETTYYPDEISSPIRWGKIVQNYSTKSDKMDLYTVRGNVVKFYPAIATAGLTINLEYVAAPAVMEQDDYSTGNVSAITQGGVDVIGSGTGWASLTGNLSIFLPDGLWYKVSSITSNTQLVLETPYQGATISTNQDYRIGETPLIPGSYQDLLWLRPVGIYYLMKGQEARAKIYFSNDMRAPGLFESLLRKMRQRYSSPTSNNILKESTGRYWGSVPVDAT